MVKREIVSRIPGKQQGVVFTQRRLADGSWHNLNSRPATPEELKTGIPMPEIPMPEEETKGESGSHNTHARLAPSASKQWAGCLASLAFIEANRHRIPEDRGSVYADEGTEAHDWAAKVFLKKIKLDEVPENFRAPVGDYVSHCLEGLEKGTQVFVEVKVPLFYQPGETGTCDFAAIGSKRAVIRDLKYGAGVLVKSMENSQLAIYGLSMLRKLEAERGEEFSPDMIIDIAVFQPRHHEGADQPAWVLSYADLQIFGATLENAANKARKGIELVIEGCGQGDDQSCEDITLVTGLAFAPEEGDHGACRWCPAKAICHARLKAIAADLPQTNPEAFILMMDDLSKEEKKLPVRDRLETRGVSLSDEFLVAVERCASGLQSYLDDVHEYLAKRVVDNGEVIPGLKVVLGRQGNRAWTDEDAADKWLAGHLKQKERYDFKLKGPAKIEVIIAGKLENTRTKNKFESLIGRSEAKKVLALDEDRREAVGSDVAVMDNLEAEEFAI